MFAPARDFARRALLRGGSPVWYARKYAEIARTLPEYHRRRSVGREVAQEATPEDKAIVEELRRAGILSLDRPFDLTDELIAGCWERLSEKKKEAEKPRHGKLFWDSLIDDGEELPADSIFMRYASQERLIRLASMYLGQAAYFWGVHLQYSFSTPDKPAASQLWHRDGADTNIFKVFVYCSDVLTEADGPFHAADRRANGWRGSPILPMRSYNDADFSRFVEPGSIHAMVGPRGTTFLCDTKNCFHYGSRCVNPRLACFFTYTTYSGLYKPPERGLPTEHLPLPNALLFSRVGAASRG